MAKESLAPTQQQSDVPDLRAVNGPPDAASVMLELWHRAADGLTADELEWFAGADELGLLALSNIQSLFSSLACLIGESEPFVGGQKGLSHNDQVSAFHFAAEEMARVSSLMEISAAANLRLRNLEKLSSAQT